MSDADSGPEGKRTFEFIEIKGNEPAAAENEKRKVHRTKNRYCIPLDHGKQLFINEMRQVTLRPSNLTAEEPGSVPDSWVRKAELRLSSHEVSERAHHMHLQN